jgi:hypothetical protein
MELFSFLVSLVVLIIGPRVLFAFFEMRRLLKVIDANIYTSTKLVRMHTQLLSAIAKVPVPVQIPTDTSENEKLLLLSRWQPNALFIGTLRRTRTSWK